MPHNTMFQIEVPDNHVQIGGRKSKLAVIQSKLVKQSIEHTFPHLSCSILALSTLGDKVLSKPLYSFGGKSLWTKELEALLIEPIGDFPKLDLIVHSLKDMPTNLPDEFELGCILEREDPRDVLVMKKGSPYKSLKDLPEGSVVGTSSLRRQAQLLKSCPHLNFQDVRGNLATRLAKLDDPESPYACIVLAAAGLIREGLADRITCALDAPDMYYAVGQGALGIEIRKDCAFMKPLLSQLEHLPSAYRCTAERTMMRLLEGGCSVPLGVQTMYNEDTEELYFKGIIVSPDGSESVEAETTAHVSSKSDAERVGEEIAIKLTALGGKEILNAINFEKINQVPSKSPEVQVQTPVSA
ncbi:hypothetical protein JCM33374_g131 [Metschnikowia sp. JCM 33374]|nr:hypothetical protein JCM33374_g131 [Metschnikowia sp. JCM 33374]